jgi:hypothetical protein
METIGIFELFCKNMTTNEKEAWVSKPMDKRKKRCTIPIQTFGSY